MTDQDLVTHLASCKRILILGSAGSGKTTLALRLGRILNVDAIHLDACFWRLGWSGTPQEEWQEKVAQLTAEPSWIMDGTYESTLHLRIPAADAVIVLEAPRLSCLWRVLKRKLTIDDEHRPDAPPGQPLDWPFFRYIWRYPYITRPFVYDAIRQHGQQKPLIVLERATEAEQLIQRLDRVIRSKQ